MVKRVYCKEGKYFERRIDDSIEVGGENEQVREAVMLALEKLKKRNARSYEIIRRSVLQGESMKEIGISYGIGLSRVAQIKDKGLEFLADQLSSKKMGEFGVYEIFYGRGKDGFWGLNGRAYTGKKYNDGRVTPMRMWNR